MFKTFYISLILFLATSFHLHAANNITASASFQPSTLPLDQQGLLNIVIEGVQGNIVPELPNVEGLSFKYFGTQQSINAFNSKVSISHVYSFTVAAQKTGEFLLPPFNIEIDGKKYPVTPAKLTVTEKSETTENKPSITLETIVKNTHVYIGQLIPIDLILSVPNNIRIFNNINLEATETDFFSSSAIAPNTKPNLTNTQQQVFPFKLYITPLKPGDKTLQYKMALAIQKPRSAKRNRPMNNLLDPFDPQFDSLFNSLIGAAEEVEITSPPLILSISPLPQTNKPENFTGAIGQFTLESFSVTPQEAQAGDPLTLKLEIKGQGNFERISAPTLPDDANWKTYSPKSTFTPTDKFGYEGTKTFEYVIIPQFDTITQSPNITFNFFDPLLGRYMELTPEPLSLKITPPPLSTFSPSTSLKESNNIQSSTSEPQLLPIKLEITRSVKSLIPLIAKKWFIINSLALTLALVLPLVLYKRVILKQKSNGTYIKELNTQKAIRSNLQKVRKAYAKQDSLSFYEAATIVILELVSRDHPKSPPALTAHDVTEYLSEKNLSEDYLTFTQNLFHKADMLKFSGDTNHHPIEPESLKKLEAFIQELEK